MLRSTTTTRRLEFAFFYVKEEIGLDLIFIDCALLRRFLARFYSKHITKQSQFISIQDFYNNIILEFRRPTDRSKQLQCSPPRYSTCMTNTSIQSTLKERDTYIQFPSIA